MQTNTHTTTTFTTGARVRLVDDYRFFDKGDEATVNAIGNGVAEVLFDGGASAHIDADMLELITGDFRILFEHGRLGSMAFTTEPEAVDYAESLGCTSFRVIRVAEEVRYEVNPKTHTVQPYTFDPEADPIPAF